MRLINLRLAEGGVFRIDYPATEGWKSRDWQNWFSSLREMADKRFDDLVAGKGDAAEQVYEIRKVLKRLRAGTRMLRVVADPQGCRAVRSACRDAGRILSESRDQTVRLETFRGQFGDEACGEPESVNAVRLRLEKESSQVGGIAAERALEACRLFREAALSASSRGKAGRSAILRSLQGLLKRSRTEYLDIRNGHSEDFHELRKRVKDLYYNLTVLPVDAKEEIKDWIARLKKLSDILGEENDNAVLMDWLSAEGYKERDDSDLWVPLRECRQKLRDQSIETGIVLEEISLLYVFKG